MKKISVLLTVMLSITTPLSELYAEYKMQPDKKLHLEAGIIIGAGAYFICPAAGEYIFGKGVIHPVIWSISMATLAGAGKEIVYDDMMGRGYPDRKDFYFTVAGGVVSGITLGLTEYFFTSGDKSVSLQVDPSERILLLSYQCRF